MEKKPTEQQLRKGKRLQYFFHLFGFPITCAILTSACIFVVGNVNITLFKCELYAFAFYYLLSIYLLRTIAGSMLLQAYLCLMAGVLMLSSCLLLIMGYAPLHLSRIMAVNIPYPANLLIVVSLVVIYLLYMLVKSFELDIKHIVSELKRVKRYDPKSATYVMHPSAAMRSITIFTKRHQVVAGKLLTNKKSRTMADRMLGCLLIFAYGFVPFAPYTLRGIGHGEPLSWVMLLGALLLALLAGLGVEMFFALFLAFRRIEKQVGCPLMPISDLWLN
ncbi:MAG: hypothetical protein KAS93_07340 [Gammaproteobacteria bacterium]|nr:hypothetical protein [Gammaproteobacteria bacterium]